MIKCINIYKKYEENSEYVNNNISLDFDKGLISIIGSSGSGKSTLLHIIGTLLTPTSGKVLIDDIDIYELNDTKRAEFRNKNIGFVFQNFCLEETYTAYENVELPLLIAKDKNKKEKIDKALDFFKMLDKENTKVCKLSGGEKQRVAIARAIVNNPKYLLCDEPTGNLDTKNSQIVFDYLKELSKNILVIVVTHNLDLAKISDKVYNLQDGSLVCL